MGLVSYPDSDTETEPEASHQSQTLNPQLKRKLPHSAAEAKQPSRPHPPAVPPPPPLPSSFHDLYASSTRTTIHDDPSLHGGRKRLIPHIEGNWPTHVYLEWHAPPSTHTHLTSLLTNIQSATPSAQAIHTLLTSPLSVPLPLHISLSAPLSLPTPQTTPYLDALTSALTSLSLKPFTVTPSSLDWVPNTTRSRWFLVLRLARPSEGEDSLRQLLKVCNTIAHQFGLDQLYASASNPTPASNSRLGNTRARDRRPTHAGPNTPKSPSPSTSAEARAIHGDTSPFHISIAWTLCPPSGATSDPPSIPGVEDILTMEILPLRIGFDAVKIKIGNTITALSIHEADDKRYKARGRAILG